MATSERRTNLFARLLRVSPAQWQFMGTSASVGEKRCDRRSCVRCSRSGNAIVYPPQKKDEKGKKLFHFRRDEKAAEEVYHRM
jgi:hypothetical protein